MRVFSSLAAAAAIASLGPLTTACAEKAPVVAGVGDRLQSFMTQAAPDAKTKCMVCQYGGSPVLMAVGDPADGAFADDLVRVQALIAKQPKVEAFAVAARIENGKFVPFADQSAAFAAVAALKEKLGITFPVVLIPTNADDYVKQGYRKFDETYRLAGTRMLFFADAEGTVRWAQAMKTDERDRQLAALESAVTAAL